MGNYYLIAFNEAQADAAERFKILFGGSIACNDKSHLVYSQKNSSSDVTDEILEVYPEEKRPLFFVSLGYSGWHIKSVLKEAAGLEAVGTAHTRSPTWQQDIRDLTPQAPPQPPELSPIPEEPFRAIDTQAAKKIENELAKLRGVDGIVKVFRTVSARAKIENLKAAAQLQDAEKPGYHLLMLGNPGTGKTTVARLYAQWLKAHGILSQGQLVETDRSGLVADYIGKTETKTEQVLESAKGGVLYIDEAYSLYRDSSNDFGAIALAQIVKRMEDARGDFAVIMAGYPREMQGLLEMNSGLRSRFSLTLNFPDYSNKVLTRIARDQLAAHKLTPCGGFDEIFSAIAADLRGRDQKNFGNGRFVRTFVEALEGEIALRLDQAGKLDALLGAPGKEVSAAKVKDLLTLTTEDLWVVAERECNLPRRKIGPPGSASISAPAAPVAPVTGTVIFGKFDKRDPS